VQDLENKIERATIKLRDIYKADLNEVKFSDKVLGDAKRFIAIMLFTALRFYVASLKHEELLRNLLQEKMMNFITKLVISGKVYQIILAICRYET